MSSLPASLLAVSVCLLLSGCKQTPAVDVRAEADSLRSIETQWAEANKAKDFDRIVSFAAPNIVLMNANQPLAAGREALRRAAETWLADTLVSKTYVGTIDEIEVAASGDLAYTRGTNRYSRSTPNGPVEEAEKWVTIYKKIDGKWKAILDIYNSDKPGSSF